MLRDQLQHCDVPFVPFVKTDDIFLLDGTSIEGFWLKKSAGRR
jgi:hypothetical protein